MLKRFEKAWREDVKNASKNANDIRPIDVCLSCYFFARPSDTWTRSPSAQSGGMAAFLRKVDDWSLSISQEQSFQQNHQKKSLQQAARTKKCWMYVTGTVL